MGRRLYPARGGVWLFFSLSAYTSSLQRTTGLVALLLQGTQNQKAGVQEEGWFFFWKKGSPSMLG